MSFLSDEEYKALADIDWSSIVNDDKKKKAKDKDTKQLKKFYRYSNKKQQKIRQRTQKKYEKLDKRNDRMENRTEKMVWITLIIAAILIILGWRAAGNSLNAMPASYTSPDRSPVDLVRYCLGESDPHDLAQYVTGSEDQMDIVNDQYDRKLDIITWRIKDVKVSEDKDDPEHVVHYSCTVPGVVNTSFEKALRSNITNDAKYSKRIRMEGTLRTTVINNKRYIELGDGNNPLYLEALVYHIGADGMVPSEYLSGKFDNDDDFHEALTYILSEVYLCYDEVFDYDDEDMMNVLSELESYASIPKIIISDESEEPDTKPVSIGFFKKLATLFTSYWPLMALFALITLLRALRMHIILPARVKKYNHLVRLYKGDTLMSSNSHRLGSLTAALTDGTKPGYGYIRKKAMQLGTDHDSEEATVIETSMALVETPDNDKDLLTALCEEYSYMEKRGFAKDYLTRGGWALSALIAGMMMDMTPDKMDQQEQAVKRISDEYNKDAEEIIALEKRINEIVDKSGISKEGITAEEFKERTGISFSEFKSMREERDRLYENLKDIFVRCVEQNVVPLAWIFNKATNPNESTVRFIRQSAMTGLLPWLEKYKGDAKIAQLYKNAREACIELAGRTNALSFFEVRIFSGCTPSRFAVELKRILNMIDPDTKYADTEKLMKRINNEVPGAMELLAGYPLRLINPKVSKEGVFEAEPFEFLSYTQYQGTLKVGPVIKRFHEAFDMTKPNASGVNIRVFTDQYQAVPIVFHEHEHYRNDMNEASVWLKTYIFSRDFYKCNRRSDPKKDSSFIAMQNLMGGKPSPKKTDALNKFIAKMYGQRVDTKIAEKVAANRINNINTNYDISNKMETWCPEKPFPLLGEKEGMDYNTYRIIHDATVRFLTVPKTLTETQFRQTLSVLKKISKGRVRSSLRKIKHTSDASVIKKYALESPSGEVRRAAAAKLSDTAAMKTLALYDSDKSVRMIALGRLNDQAVLAEAAANDIDPKNRQLAVEKLTDQAALASVAKGNDDINTRLIAIKKITDVSVLDYIAKYDSIRNVQDKARDRAAELRKNSD